MTIVAELKVEINYGPAEGSLTLIPQHPATLRTLEGYLHKSKIFPTIVRNPPKAIVPIDLLDSVSSSLCDWDIVLDDTVENQLSTTRSTNFDLEKARIELVKLSDINNARIQLHDLSEINLLDEHQVSAVAACSHPDIKGICLFDEQGLGKTIETLFSFHMLYQRGDINKMIVFSPKNMILEWAHDTKRFFGDQYTITPITGSEHDKRKALNNKTDIYVTNFETAGQLTTRLKWLASHSNENTLLVVDESFFVKNPGAKRSKAIKEIRSYCDRCIVLCGTPAPNRPHDIIEQFNIADGGITFKNFRIPESIDDARNRISEILDTRGVYLRRLKSQVMKHLPERSYHRILIPFQPAQNSAYKEALQALMKDVKQSSAVSFKRELTSFMSRRMALLQLCSNPSSILDDYDETPSKLIALDSILEDLIENRNEKVVLWSYFKISIDAIFNRYTRYNPVRIDGTITSSEERSAAVRRFQDDDETMLFVANPAAAGAGITLHRARYAIYESMSNQAAHYLQSLDRIHRRGQDRPVEYLVLLCDQSIEVNEYDKLLSKEASAQELLGDEVVEPVTRESFLSVLKQAASLIGINQS